MIDPGSINVWVCPDCHGLTVAIHIDAGVTPMMLRCRRTEDCPGMAISSMYPPPPVPEHVMNLLEWEWYKPSNAEFVTLDHDMRDHVEAGGLMLRPLSVAGRLLR